MTIALPAEVEKWITQEAERRGIKAPEYAAEIIVQAAPHPDQATIDLLEQWRREDHSDDPTEIAEGERQTEELMQNLARNRIEMEGPNARKLWPPQS